MFRFSVIFLAVNALNSHWVLLCSYAGVATKFGIAESTFVYFFGCPSF